ncbi:MAG: TolC family protein [Saprospiraceae bacterium]
MRYLSFFSVIAFSFLFVTATNAQETWDLAKCIQFAQQNSLQVKQANLSVRNANLLQKQAEYNRYPTLNASGGGNLSFGRTIDPVSNEFVSESFGSNSFSVNAGATVYNGGRINNTIKQSGLDTEAAKKDAEVTTNDLALNIASAYLSILLAEEQLETAQQRFTVSQEQLERTDRLIQAGALPANDRLDFVAQIARDEQAIVNAQNSVDINYLNIKQLMEMSPDFDLRIQKPEVVIPADAAPGLYDLRTVYNQALGTQPQVEAGEIRTKSAQLGIDIAKAGKLPSVTVFGNVNTFWSSRSPRIESEMDVLVPIDFILPSGEPFTVFSEESIPTFGKTPYFEQLGSNFGQGLGVSVSVPIFNQYRNDINMQRAELGVTQQELQNDQVKQTLKQNIQRAIADARAAEKSLAAAESTIDATRQAYENAQKRFDLGAINAFELTTAKNNFDNAEIDLISAKYQYLFNIKVVEFYQGQPLTLD